LLEEHAWFERSTRPSRLFLLSVGWDRRKQKPLMAIFRPHRARSPSGPDKQVEFSIYLGGKLIRSYTTKTLKGLGAEVVTDAGHHHRPKGDYAVYTFQGYDGYLQGKTKYGCLAFKLGKKTVLIDISTGDVIRNPYPQTLKGNRHPSNK